MFWSKKPEVIVEEKFKYPVWIKEERTSSYYGYGHSETTTKDAYRKAYCSKQSVSLADGRTLYEVRDGNSVQWIDSTSLTWPKYEKA